MNVGIRFTCNDCGKVFIAGNRADGLPNGIGFVLDDGSIYNACADCIIKAGEEKGNELDAFEEFIKGLEGK